MQNRTELTELVISSISAASDIPAARIQPGSRLTSELKLESIGLLEVFFEIEQRIGKKVNIAEISRLAGTNPGFNGRDLRVDDIIDYLIRKEPA